MTYDPQAQGWRPMHKAALPGGQGVPWSRRIDDVWCYGLQTTADHANPQGALHGGVMMTLADHGLSMLAWEAVERAPCTTIQLNTQFLAAVQPGAFIWVAGEVVRRTNSLVFMRGIIRAADDTTDSRDVCAADGIWRVLRRA